MPFRVSSMKEFEALRARLAKNQAGAPRVPAQPAGGKPRARRKRPVPPVVGAAAVPEPPDLSEVIARIPGAGRTWSLLMPYGELLNANDRPHHMARARIVKRLRGEACQVAQVSRVPALERAHVFYVLHPNTRARKRDPGNWAPSAKAYVDGLVDAGVLPDDNDVHLSGPFPVMGAPVAAAGGRMTLVVVELRPDPA